LTIHVVTINPPNNGALIRHSENFRQSPLTKSCRKDWHIRGQM